MSKPKYDTFNDLGSKQDTFNDYDRSVVQPLLGLSQSELDRLSFADRAKRIDDEVIRGRYCNLAIEMLEANISHYKHEATIKPFPVKNMTSVIVSTFVAAAIGYYIDGFGAAFLCAGLSTGSWILEQMQY